MAVFGEETIDIDVFSGMTLLTGHLTDDYSASLVNAIKTSVDEIIIRDDLVLIQDAAQTSYRTIAVTEPIPRNLIKRDFEVFTAVGSPTANSPTLIAAYDNGTTRNVTWLNCNSSTASSVTQGFTTADRGLKAFCQYRDRYYGSNGTSQIFRVFNFSTTPATNLTTTDLAAVGVNFLISFKNRIFGFTRNRIYWTDLAAIGGYPETWNLTLNFSDLPSVDFDITIHNVKIYRDKIYMFTDKGVYYFQVNGDPINWVIQVVSANFSVFDRDSVCINKNIVFLTDQTNVYTFDGSKFVTLPNLRTIFYTVGFHPALNIYGVINIYPYEEGILLSVQSYQDVSGNYATGQSIVFYYDLDIWSIIAVNSVSGLNGADQIINAGVGLTPYRGKFASSYIYYIRTASSQHCIFVDSSKWKGDCLSIDHVNGARLTKYFNLRSPSPTLKDRRFLLIKEYYFYGRLNMADTVDITIGGSTFATADMNNLSAVYRCRATATQSAFQAKNQPLITIAGNITPDKTVADGIVPPFVINGIEAIVQTDNRAATAKKT